MTSLFIFSLKDFIKYLLCFDGMKKSKYYEEVSRALTKDITTFDKQQIYSIQEYNNTLFHLYKNII